MPDIADESASFRDEKAERLSFSLSAPPSRSYTPDSAYHSGTRNHDAAASTTLVDLGVPLSAQPAISGSLPASEDQPRPRHIDDVVREKLNKVRARAARSTPTSTSASDPAQIGTPRGGVAQCRQEEDGGVCLAGGRLGERIRGEDASDGLRAESLQEDVWSARRNSFATLPPPYEER